MLIPWTPTVQSNAFFAGSKFVNNETEQERSFTSRLEIGEKRESLKALYQAYSSKFFVSGFFEKVPNDWD